MIRPIVPADTPIIVSMTEATGLFKPMEIVALREVLDDFHAVHHLENHHGVAMEEDGEIVAFAYYGPVPMTDRTWQLWWIAVRKDQQGKGAGSSLLRFVEEDIRTTHEGRLLFIETGSLPHYDLTRAFYRKHGYEQHAQLKDFYADGDSMVIFRKKL